MKLVTGRFHGHNVPGTLRLCEGSGLQLESPRDDPEAWEPPKPREQPSGSDIAAITRVDAERSTAAVTPLSQARNVSVRTVSGGLPGSRRH